MPPLPGLRQLVPLAAWLALAGVAGAQSPCAGISLSKLDDVRTGLISPDDCKFQIGGEMRLADRYAVQIKEAGFLTIRATSMDQRLRVCVTETTGGCSQPPIDLRGPGNYTFYVSSEARTTGPYRLALSFQPAGKKKPPTPPPAPPRPCPPPAPVGLNSYWRNSFANACAQPGGSSRTLSYTFQLKEKGPVIVELEPLAGDSARVRIELTCGKEFAGEARRVFRQMGPGPCELVLRSLGPWQGEFRLRLLGGCSSQTTAEAGQLYEGEFTPANCRRAEAIPGRTERLFGRMYGLDLAQRSDCLVDLASSGFKPHLLLLDQNLGVVQEEDSRLEAVLPKGRHRFWAEAAPDNAAGTYTFRVQCRLAPPCEWRQLKPGESRTDRFAGGDCTANDFTKGSGGERLAHAYLLVAGQTPVKVTLESGDAELISSAGKPLPRTVRAAVPGKYEFLVVANRGGVEYRLQVE
jgi:hypothetical protein